MSATDQNTSASDAPVSASMTLEDIERAEFDLHNKKVNTVENTLRDSNDPHQILKAQIAFSNMATKSPAFGSEGANFKAYFFDPDLTSDTQGYKHKPTNISDSMLRAMAAEPVIASIIGTRQSQVTAFAKPQEDEFSTGFRIVKKRPYYETGEPKLSKSDKAKIQEYTNFYVNCGDKKSKWAMGTFSEFLEHLVEDSLILDKAVFEVGRTLGGQVSRFRAVDGATFRYATSIDENFDEDMLPPELREEEEGMLPAYVQLKDGQIYEAFYPWEISFGVRNSSTDIRRNMYGQSELEKLARVVTGLLNSFEYNSRIFTNGSHHEGIFFVKSEGNRSKLSEFKNAWGAKRKGVRAAHDIPVIEGEGVEFVKTKSTNKEMEFQEWQHFLLKLACALYKISPEEIGFEERQGSSMFEGNGQHRLEYSRDKGLKPLLTHIENWINRHLQSEIDDDFRFEFVGVNVRSEEDLVDLLVKKVGSFMTLNEARERVKLAPVEHGDMPLNSVYVQGKQAAEMAAMAEDAAMDAEGDMDAMEGGDSSVWDAIASEGGEETMKAMMYDPVYGDDIQKAFSMVMSAA